jgi:hypothetical protein
VRQREGLGYSVGGRGKAHAGTHPKARKAAIKLVEEGLQRALRVD